MPKVAKKQGGGGAPRDRARQARVEQLYTTLVRSTEIQAIVALEFGCSPRTVRDDIARLEADLAFEGRAEREKRVQQLRAAFGQLLRLAVGKDDLRAAAHALDKLARIEGAYAAEKLEVQPNVSPGLLAIVQKVAGMTPSERVARRAELIERQRAQLAGDDHDSET